MTNSPGFLRRLRLVLAASLPALLVWPVLSSAQAILDNEVIEPRTFGYVVGDKIRREVRLSVHADYRLDEASLPQAGRLDRWLEVAAPQVRTDPISNGQRYTLVLTYQIFNAPAALETVTIPQQNLRIRTGTQALTTLIPALRVTVSPITSGPEVDSLTGSSLQQDRAPAPLPVQARERRLAWILAGLLALLLYVAWRRGLMQLIARRNLPFASAARALRRLQTGTAASTRTAAGLKIVHEAINRTAGRAVFAHNLDDFLAAHPHYAGLRADFERLFAASEKIFFAGPVTAAPIENLWPALLRLCRQCSKLERRALAVRSSG